MQKLLEFIDRFYGEVEVRFAEIKDIPACVGMAYSDFIDRGLDTSPGTRKGLGEHFRSVMKSESPAAVILAERKGKTCGMIVCAMGCRDLWDCSPVMQLWFFYVKPKHRRSPRTALALMRAALSLAFEWGAKRLRLAVTDTDERLVKHYESALGFRQEATHVTYSIDLEE